ncbi:hypothetical protein N7495_002158 [Penicillium taxi]|uniref:uncharacterized protein n=1 Tax=Penicillium taxi TaxID=168475 RepID=UPI0025450D54|nr:uncharacterized protein N7495_002158 [Penicillium taxi]KAJ5901630.1 hypothetical protein N7495_002158 [Penicillium taxi]
MATWKPLLLAVLVGLSAATPTQNQLPNRKQAAIHVGHLIDQVSARLKLQSTPKPKHSSGHSQEVASNLEQVSISHPTSEGDYTARKKNR